MILGKIWHVMWIDDGILTDAMDLVKNGKLEVKGR